jgi:TRAP-type C4-dicarboxylate transport system permease small subunit
MKAITQGLGALLRTHDRLADLTYGLSILAVAAIALVTSMEVIMRYAFNAPLGWSGDSVMVALSVLTFLAVPRITRENAHVAMTFAVDGAPPPVRVALARLGHAAGFAVCGICGWYGADAALQHYQTGVQMITVTAWPKWWVTGTIAYGLLSAALYFLRHLLEAPRDAREHEWTGTYS